MAKNKIPQFVKDAAVADYQSGSSIGEIVLSLGISETTVYRALADAGLKNMKRHKTDAEYELLEYLRDHGVHTIKDAINKGIK